MKEVNGVRYYNASNVNVGYALAHPPHVIKVQRKKKI
jgi:hypothetical protein